jgi:diguanylate cyclase (GGDEF)-like protein
VIGAHTHVMNANRVRLTHMRVQLPAFLDSPRKAGDNDSVQVLKWHPRGQLHFVLGLVIMVTASVVTGTVSASVVGILVGAGVAAATVRFALVSWGIADQRWTLLLWPVATCTTLSMLHTASDEAGALLAGLIVLAFQFIGITQPPGRGLWFMVPAAAVLFQLTEMSPSGAIVRLPLAMLVWLVVSEVPSWLIGELQAKQHELEKLATTDPLTGLLNRSLLEAHLMDAGSAGAVALIDMDHFKDYNDIHGHVAGDLLLIDFAEALRANTRGVDRVFRYGGEEFLVVFPGTTSTEAAEILDRCARVWSGHDSGLTFSAGVADGGEDSVMVADALLYQAKRGGRARVFTVERSLPL